MILVYSEHITRRLKYITGVIFRDILKVPFGLTSSVEEISQFDGPVVIYGKKDSELGVFIPASELLFERKIHSVDPGYAGQDGNDLLFYSNTHEKNDIPFDLFSAAFYMVTRYEEYLPYRKDPLGRFPAEESLAYQKGFLQKAVVNRWALLLKEKISGRWPQYAFPDSGYRFISTIDIDAAWAYRQKGVFRTIGGLANDLLHPFSRDPLERLKVLAGLQRDPFDTYDFQQEIHARYHLRPFYFVLFGDYGPNDKNISYRNRKFRELIKSLADRADIGIHPSFGSNNDPSRLREEVRRLSDLLHREVIRSRQHFLMLQFPTTYRNLINLDIQEDYTMGFASQPGFRAGIATPYPFFDLDLDIETNLKIFPFTYMEGTLKDYLNLTTAEATEMVKPLIREVKSVGGTFIPIWHNESLSETHRWKGWRTLYEEMIKEATT
ncbi:MAG: hypothetical protein Kow00127_20510 [Bacteroidales bacterium]